MFFGFNFWTKNVFGFVKSILKSSYKDLKTCKNYLTFNILFKRNSKSIQIFKDHSNFNSEIVKENWNIYIFWVIFKKFQMFLCFGLCNTAKQYSSNATYSYINSLFTLDRPLEVPISHFLSFFVKINIIAKNFMKRPMFF